MSPAVLTLIGGVAVALIGFAGTALLVASQRTESRLRRAAEADKSAAEERQRAAEAEASRQAAEVARQQVEAARKEREAEEIRAERDRLAKYHEDVHVMHLAEIERRDRALDRKDAEIERLTEALAAAREARP